MSQAPDLSAPLAQQQCRPLQGAQHRLDPQQVAALLAGLPDWRVEAGELCREFRFADFHRAMAFVNAMAWIAHQQDHHPDFAAGYNYCRVRFSTHDVGGLSLNDFICAARLDALQA